MRTLVFLEDHDGALQKDSLGVLSKAASLDGEVEAVLLGSGVEGLAAEAGRYGASRVHVADDPRLDAPLPQPRVDVLERLVRDDGFDTVVFAATVLSADIAAALAARLEAGLNWDLTDLVEEGGRLVGKRPALGDSVYVDVGWSSGPRLALIRSGTFEPAESGGSAEVVRIETRLEEFSLAATMIEQAHEDSEGPSIEDADVIVAGGRGLGGPENFALVEELAESSGRCRRGDARGGRRRLVPVRRAGRADGQDRLAEALHRLRDLGGDPAQGRDAGLGPDRRDQQGPERADLRVRRPRRRRRPARDPPEADRAGPSPQGRVKPSDYPPPFDPAEFVAAPADPEIEVGVLIVGAGPAGLACAIRLGQLLEDAPELAERLGDVPVAVLEKGKQPGSHLLSGAVVNPRSLRTLFEGRVRTEAMPFLGRVEHESVYFLTPKRAVRIPAPPTMRNRGNFVASLSQLGRWLAEQAEEAGATILPETAAAKLLVADGRVRGVRTGDRGRGRDGEELSNFEPGSDVLARVTVLAEGTQGHLTGVALDRFGLEGENPQVWALGVKEVWRVPKPLDHVIHTLGWPLRGDARSREFGGSFIYPMGDDMVTVGMVVGLDYRDVELSVHDLLQELKTHPLVRKIVEGGERIAWGAKTIPEGGFLSLPRRLNAPGLLICGDGAGLVNVPALKGIHYAVESGRLAAEAAFASLQRGETPARSGALAGYDDSLRESFVWEDLKRVRNMRPAFGRGFWRGGALAGAMTATRGKFPPGDSHTEPDADQELSSGGRAASYPAPDGVLTFDKLSSVFLSGNKTRDDAPNHIRVRTDVPPELAKLWEHMCPARVYEAVEGGVEVTASNCVQCGAITAKGGRLTPPEGGSGPEYTVT